MNLDQYTIPKEGLDLESLLDDWRWLLPESYTVLLINHFAEFLIEDPSGIIYHFEPGTGTLREIAKDQDELEEIFNDDDQLSDFLMIGLVDACVQNEMRLKPGKCYGYKKPISLGGSYEVENCEVKSLIVFLSVMGQFHEQIKDVPDGTPIGNITFDGVPIVRKA